MVQVSHNLTVSTRKNIVIGRTFKRFALCRLEQPSSEVSIISGGRSTCPKLTQAKQPRLSLLQSLSLRGQPRQALSHVRRVSTASLATTGPFGLCCLSLSLSYGHRSRWSSPVPMSVFTHETRNPASLFARDPPVASLLLLDNMQDT